MPRRVIAVDLGTRRMGIAVTDLLGLSAHPHATLPRRGGVRDLEGIAAVVKHFDAERVVLGLPINPEDTPQDGPEDTPQDGSRTGPGRAARSAQAFAERLRAILSVPVELIDESFTTVEATQVLLAADLSRKRRKQVVDRVAAAIILQRWLALNPQFRESP